MSCTILTGTTLAVHSPYLPEFARAARMVGGQWDRVNKLWRFPGFTVETLSRICEDFYPGKVTVADAIPVPAALPDYGWHGTIGADVRVTVTIEKSFDYNTKYGSTRIHIMRGCPESLGEPYRDKVFVWFASNARLAEGTTVTLVGKVKAHNSRDGISQTVLTRCKKVS